MNKSIATIAVFLLFTNLIQAQDQPRSCKNPVSPFDQVMKGKITSQIRNAHEYYMKSPDLAAGRDYTERTANLQKEVARTFQAFMKMRRDEYKKTICNYYKVDWNKAGNSSTRTLTVQPGFYLLTDTANFKRTTSGDWKGGPDWAPNVTQPTSITWQTGGHKKNDTFVDINAIYSDEFIKKSIINELDLARKELNAIGIPTELPPFLEG